MLANVKVNWTSPVSPIENTASDALKVCNDDVDDGLKIVKPNGETLTNYKYFCISMPSAIALMHWNAMNWNEIQEEIRKLSEIDCGVE